MARINYPDPSALPAEVASTLQRMAPLNIFRMLAHAPNAFLPFMRFGNALLTKTRIDPILREMAIVRVGLLSGAKYEVHQHDRISRDLGMAEEKIAGLRTGADAAAFTPAEKAVLRFTDDIVKNVRAGDETFNGLKEFLSSEEIAELTLTIGFYMMVSRFLETFDIEIEAVAPEKLNLSRSNPDAK